MRIHELEVKNIRLIATGEIQSVLKPSEDYLVGDYLLFQNDSNALLAQVTSTGDTYMFFHLHPANYATVVHTPTNAIGRISLTEYLSDKEEVSVEWLPKRVLAPTLAVNLRVSNFFAFDPILSRARYIRQKTA
jgi:hypothetical protein